MRVIGARSRGIYAGSGAGVLGRAFFDPCVQRSTPWRPTSKNVSIRWLGVARSCRATQYGNVAPS